MSASCLRNSAWFTVNTCPCVSLDACGIISDFQSERGPRIRGRFSLALFAWKTGHFSTSSCWQLVARYLGHLRSVGLLGDDFKNMLPSWLAATVDTCTCVSSGGLRTTFPRALCIWQSPVRCLRPLIEELKKLWIYWEMTSSKCFSSIFYVKVGTVILELNER